MCCMVISFPTTNTFNYNYIPFPLAHRKKNAFAVHYVKEGPKVDSSVSSPNSMEPQYATCGAAVTVEYSGNKTDIYAIM